MRNGPTVVSSVGMVGVAVVFLIRAGFHFDYTPDDTYIYLQYARNVVQHHEVAFNSGEPSYGVTSPLWLAIISVSGWSGLDPYAAGKIIDMLAAVGAIVALYALQRLFVPDRLVALLTAAAFSTHVWFLRWTGSGMETSLATLLSILFLYAIMKRRFLMAAAVTGLLVLTRPEAAIVIGLSLLCMLALHKEVRSWGVFALFTGGVFLVLFPWYAYAYRTFGTILPNTALAKSGLGFSMEGAISTLVDIGATLGASDGISLVVLAVAVGAHFVPRRARTMKDWRRLKPFVVPVVWVASLPLLYVFTSTNVVSRYLLMICPVLVLLAFAVPLQLVQVESNRRVSRVLSVLLTMLVVIYNVSLYELRVRPQIDAFARGMDECFIYIGNWLKENTPKDASVLVGDVGAIGYYSERRICDAAGLISSELLPLARMGYNAELLKHEKEYREYCQAGYVIESSRILNPPRPPHLEPLVTRTIFGLRMTSKDPVYYTVLKVVGSSE